MTRRPSNKKVIAYGTERCFIFDSVKEASETLGIPPHCIYGSIKTAYLTHGDWSFDYYGENGNDKQNKQ